MRDAASAFLADLGVEQRAWVSFAFDRDNERRRWFYIPTDHGGLPISELSPQHQMLLFKLLSSGLSGEGYATATLIMGAQPILDRLEDWLAPGGEGLGGRERVPSLYYVAIFGDPAARAWGWRFGGHHLSLNFTVVGDRVSFTPNFFGLDPAATPLIGGYEFRPLAGLEESARQLIESLDRRQRDAAVICDMAPFDLVTGNRPRVAPGARPPHFHALGRVTPPEPELSQLIAMEQRASEAFGMHEDHLAQLEWARTPKGLPSSALNPEQLAALHLVLEQYLGRMPEELAERERERIRPMEHELHFAWAGSTEANHAHYYRIEGPRLLVEYDNFHRSANHIHSVWRDPEGDFGEDMLLRHILDHH